MAFLKNSDPIDIAHAEMLQQKALYCADLTIEFLGKIVKTVSYLESKISTARNAAARDFKSTDGGKITADMRRWAADNSPEAESLNIALGKAKASKLVLEKKFDILIKQHHLYKDVAAGLRKTILGYTPIDKVVVEGWE